MMSASRASAAARSVPKQTQSATAATKEWIRRSMAALFGNDELDPAIAPLTVSGVVRGDGPRFAVADRQDALGWDGLRDEILRDGPRTALREALVGGGAAVAVGMSADLDHEVRAARDDVDDALEERLAPRVEPRASAREIDIVGARQDLEPALAGFAV